MDELQEKLHQSISNLSIGLLQQRQEILSGEVKPATQLNEYIQLGWDQLQYLCLIAGALEVAPHHLPHLIQWLHTPLENWNPFGDLLAQEGLMGALMEYGQPTERCEEIGRHYNTINPTIEIQDQPFKDIMGYCRTNQLSDQYVYAREFLVRNPYLKNGIIEITSDPRWDSNVRHWLVNCYEEIPRACLSHDKGKTKVVLCPRCGWVLEWKNGAAYCFHENTCSAAIGELSYSRFVEDYYEGDSVRTTRGIQHSIGGVEVELLKEIYIPLIENYDWEDSPQLCVEYDTHDMLIHLPSNKTIAIDLKNRKNPHDFASVASKPFPTYPDWDEAFYIDPNYRWREDGYKTAVLENWKKPSDHYHVMAIFGFMRYIRKELEIED